MSTAFRIKDLRVYTLRPNAKAGTYFKPGESKHWLVDTLISNPMSGYPKFREKRSSWGSACSAPSWSRSRPKMASSASPPAPAAFLRRG